MRVDSYATAMTHFALASPLACFFFASLLCYAEAPTWRAGDAFFKSPPPGLLFVAASSVTMLARAAAMLAKMYASDTGRRRIVVAGAGLSHCSLWHCLLDT